VIEALTEAMRTAGRYVALRAARYDAEPDELHEAGIRYAAEFGGGHEGAVVSIVQGLERRDRVR
jgi:hypothetical protein